MKLGFFALLLTLSSAVMAQDLVINAAEFGIGKFHRKDNKVHKYEANNAWKVFILPESVNLTKAFVQKNSASNYTIYFTNLEEFLNEAVKLTVSTGKKIGVINLNAHGLPGGMWFPKDAKTRDSSECASWRDAASNSDEANYNQYYSAVSKEEMLSFNGMANAARIPAFNCLTGLGEWTAIVARVPAIKTAFSDKAQVHMHSCIVGMGTLGDAYTQGLAKLLFSVPDSQMVQTSIKFGLGDWSMPEGMGFWGYESDAQLARDNSVYPTHRRDSEIMQRGDLRVAQLTNGILKSGMIKGEQFMLLTHDDRPVKFVSAAKTRKLNLPMPSEVRIPGTKVIIKIK